MTPLHLASRNGHFEVVKCLIELMDQLYFEKGWKPIHAACDVGSLEIIQLLLKHRVSLHQKTLDGWTTLGIASSNGFAHIVELLVQHDADYLQTNSNYGTAIDIAKRSGRLQFITI